MNVIKKVLPALVIATILGGCSVSNELAKVPLIGNFFPQTEDYFVLNDDTTTLIGTEEVQDVEVMYSDLGFQPEELEIEPNTRVVFINQASARLWVRSVDAVFSFNPVFDQEESVPVGGWYSVIFKKPGSWQYHNYLNPDIEGTITVAAADE